MGQQQLLLIVLGVIIVGVAVVVGIQMFGTGAAQANFDAVMADLNKIGSDAQGWYRKPASLGGGNRDFTTLTTLAQIGARDTTENGTYTLAGVDATTIDVTGVGNEDGDGDGTNVTITLRITPGALSIQGAPNR